MRVHLLVQAHNSKLSLANDTTRLRLLLFGEFAIDKLLSSACLDGLLLLELLDILFGLRHDSPLLGSTSVRTQI